MNSTYVRARIEPNLKDDATHVLKNMGLTVSDGIRLFLLQVVSEQALPFAVKVPNAETREAMKEARKIARNHRARFSTAEDFFDDLEKNARK